MLTYNKINEIEDNIFDCCDTTPGGDTPGGDCCYDTWTKDLNKVTADWKKAAAHAYCKEIEYNLTAEWKDKLKAWYEDWEATDETADALCRQLELFILHVEKICHVTGKTGEAIEILFCMAEDLYIRVDHLKAEYDELINCIKCLNKAELGSDSFLGKCIEEYGKKLDAVIATRDILISNIVRVLELVYGIDISICGEYGLKEVLRYWKQVFNCSAADCNESGQADSQHSGKHDDKGHKKCHLSPKMTFPIDIDSYFTALKNDYDEAKTEVDNLKKELDDAREKRDALQACKEGLENAIKEVDPKTRCK